MHFLLVIFIAPIPFTLSLLVSKDSQHIQQISWINVLPLKEAILVNYTVWSFHWVGYKLPKLQQIIHHGKHEALIWFQPHLCLNIILICWSFYMNTHPVIQTVLSGGNAGKQSLKTCDYSLSLLEFRPCSFLVVNASYTGFIQVLEILGNVWILMWCLQGFKIAWIFNFVSAWNCLEK